MSVKDGLRVLSRPGLAFITLVVGGGVDRPAQVSPRRASVRPSVRPAAAAD